MASRLTVWLWAALLLAAFVVSKWSGLHDPYYWDEAWSYGHAIHHFAEQRLSLSPAALDPQLYRGHPLLFYVGAAGWLQLWGNHLFWGHLFALLVSVGTAVAVTGIASRLSGVGAAVAVLVTLLWSQMFWALSARLYPEMLVALCSMLALWYYHQRQWAGVVVWCTLALFTKESAVATVAALYGYALWQHHGLNRVFWRDAGRLAVPVVVVMGWFAWQYVVRGWWLFPEHTDMMVRDAGQALRNFLHLLWTLLYYNERSVLLLAGLLATGWHFWKGQRPVCAALKHWLVLSGFFGLAYLAFSALNFQTERYLVVALVPLILGVVLWVWEVLTPKPVLRAGMLGLYVVTQVWGLYHPNRLTECSTGYLPLLRSWQSTVCWCEQNALYDEPMWSHFLMGYYMTDKHLGYLSTSRTFLFTPDTAHARYFLINNIEGGFTPAQVPDLSGMQMLYHTGDAQQQAWVYKRPDCPARPPAQQGY